MPIAAENMNTDAAQKVTAVIAQQRRLLKRWEGLSHYLGGVCAGLYLPGIDHTFDNPVRRITGRRPPLLTLEGDSLSFAGAISRSRNNKLVYTPIFSYDLTMPYTPRGGGRVLPANNIVLARRANELLANLVAYGQRISFNMHEEAGTFRFPRVIRNDRGDIVAEDYADVLGFEVDNPANTLEMISIKRLNPAEKILARHGIEYPMSVGTVELENLVAEFRAEFGELELDWSAVVDAILFKREHFLLNVPREVAIEVSPAAVVGAMRDALPKKYQWEASFNDLLLGAKNPDKPLRISRLSAVQIFPTESAQDMPDDYAGTVFAPVDWAPPAAGSSPFVTLPFPEHPPALPAGA